MTNHRYTTTDEFFEAWIEQCLDNDGALIFSGRNLWTMKNLEEIEHHMFKNLNTKGSDYRKKLLKQFEGYELRGDRVEETDDIWLLVYELLALHYGPTYLKNSNLTLDKNVPFSYIEQEVHKSIDEIENTYRRKEIEPVSVHQYQGYGFLVWLGINYYAAVASKYKSMGGSTDMIKILKKGAHEEEYSDQFFGYKEILKEKTANHKDVKPVETLPHARIIKLRRHSQKEKKLFVEEPEPSPLSDKKIEEMGRRQQKFYTQTIYQADERLSREAKRRAGYECQLDSEHKSFQDKRGNNYVEAHHLIPLSKCDEFIGKQIDRIENIVILCPNCHRAVHYGDEEVRNPRLESLYELKKGELEEAGLGIEFGELKELYE